MAFLDYLVQKGILQSKEIDEILEESADSGDTDLALQKRGVSEEQLLNLKKEYYDIPVKSVDPASVSGDLLRYIPEESVLHYQFIPVGFADGVLEVGVVDPDNMEARDALQFIASKLGVPFKIFLISKSNFNALLENYQSLTGEVHKALSEIDVELNGKKKGYALTSSS